MKAPPRCAAAGRSAGRAARRARTNRSRRPEMQIGGWRPSRRHAFQPWWPVMSRAPVEDGGGVRSRRAGVRQRISAVARDTRRFRKSSCADPLGGRVRRRPESNSGNSKGQSSRSTWPTHAPANSWQDEAPDVFRRFGPGEMGGHNQQPIARAEVKTYSGARS